MEFSKQECWNGFLLPTPGDLLDQGSNLRLLRLLHWQVYSLPLYHLGSPSLFLWFPIKALEKTLAVLHLHSPQRAFSPSLSPD